MQLQNIAIKTQGDALLRIIQEVLEDNKVLDWVCLPLAGKSDMADYMVIGSGSSSRHVLSMAEDLRRKMPNKPVLEGGEQGDWVVLDGGDVIVHLMRSEVRDYYKIEEIWSGDVSAQKIMIG